ncbi:putative serine/threonine-protein kinase [Trichinella papuae]|uniref:Putative serine/threonine-protein kinase n=1 Tax=Trichinella papuae TaxID=268474 RepID=A0A0V1N590_9BILA|nr:putative serine/threonine-protein kinase [Trichinella papuae]
MATNKPKTPEALAAFYVPKDIINDQYEVVKLLGIGGVGAVFQVKDKTDNKHYALKAEWCDGPMSIHQDKHIMKLMESCSVNFCHFVNEGSTNLVRYLVMTLTGDNLHQLRRRHGVLSTSTVVRVGEECVRGLRDLHRQGFVHRDIKPSNIAISRQQSDRGRIYLLDFSCARQYVVNGQLRPPRHKPQFCSTPHYASVNSLRNKEMGPGDDLISLLYSLAELHQGKLPWKIFDPIDTLWRLKRNVTAEELFADMPAQFGILFKKFKSLSYGDVIDYEFILDKFQEMKREFSIKHEDPYEWEK